METQSECIVNSQEATDSIGVYLSQCVLGIYIESYNLLTNRFLSSFNTVYLMWNNSTLLVWQSSHFGCIGIISENLFYDCLAQQFIGHCFDKILLSPKLWRLWRKAFQNHFLIRHYLSPLRISKDCQHFELTSSHVVAMHFLKHL